MPLPFRCLVALCTLLLPIRLHAEAPFKFAITPGKLPKNVVPISYDIQLRPTIEKRVFTGFEMVALNVREPTKTIALNVSAVAISSAKLRGANGQGEQTAGIAIDAKEQVATLTFPKEIGPGAWQLALDFSGTINQSGQGLLRDVSGRNDGREKKHARHADGAGGCAPALPLLG